MSVIICNLCEFVIDPNVSLVWQKEGFDILRCNNCGLIFRKDLPSVRELNRIYSDEYFISSDNTGAGYLNYISDGLFFRMNGRRKLDVLEYYAEKGKILDVGCAAGFFLKEAKDRGWQTAGIELSETMADWAKKNFELGIIVGDFRKAEFLGQFDVITMWDYLEHSLDPMGDLERANRFLKQGGILAFSTGDTSSLVACLSGKRWHLLTPRHHNYYFSRTNLDQYLEKNRFKIIRTDYDFNYYPIRYLFHKLRTMFHFRLLDNLAVTVGKSRVGSWAIPVNFFDIVTVYAVKR